MNAPRERKRPEANPGACQGSLGGSFNGSDYNGSDAEHARAVNAAHIFILGASAGVGFTVAALVVASLIARWLP